MTPRTVHRRWDGQAWQDLSGGIKGAPSGECPEVDALAIRGTTLDVGGIFTTAQNGATAVTVHDVAAWNTQTGAWSALGTGIAAGRTCGFCLIRVDAFAVSGSSVFAAGPFGSAGRVAVNSIAQWNGSTWRALGKGLYSCTSCSPVQAGAVATLVLSGSTLYAGGTFEYAGIAGREHRGQLEHRPPGLVRPGLRGGGRLRRRVFALAHNGTGLIVGGDFTKALSETVNSLAVWSGSAWPPSTATGPESSSARPPAGGGLGARSPGLRHDSLRRGGLRPSEAGRRGHPGRSGLVHPGAPAWAVQPMAQATATVETFAADPASGIFVAASSTPAAR